MSTLMQEINKFAGEISLSALFSTKWDNESLSEAIKESVREQCRLVIEDFDRAKLQICEEIKDHILNSLKDFLNTRKDITGAELAEELKEIFFKEVQGILNCSSLAERIDLSLNSDDLGIKKLVVEREVYKDNCMADLLVGAMSVGGALLLKRIGRKTGFKIGEAAGIVIGGFLGSAMGSGVAEGLYPCEREIVKKEAMLDSAGIVSQLKDAIERNLISSIESLRAELVIRAKAILNKMETVTREEDNYENIDQ